MFALIAAGVALAVAVLGYINSRVFVRTRLRFVDAVQRPIAPWVAGLGAALLGAVVVTFLPIVGAGTAIAFGLGVGTGVAQGVRDIKRGTTAGLLEP